MESKEFSMELAQIDYKLGGALSYPAYRELVQHLVDNNSTSGDTSNEKYADYTRINQQRMKRLDKTIKLLPEAIRKLQLIAEKQTWLVLTESWCGDAAQNIPVLNRLAALNPNIELKLLMRDENPDIMDQFLTNGARSIPKLIILNSQEEVLGTWGPRPETVQQLVIDKKNAPDDMKEIYSIKIQKWYNANKGIDLQKEIINLLD